MFLCHLIHWSSVDIQVVAVVVVVVVWVKFYGYTDIREMPPSGELNTRRVAEYSDFGPIGRYISETVQDRR